MNLQGVFLGYSLFLLTLLAEAGEEPSVPAEAMQHSADAAQLAAELTARYRATPSHCEDDPAYKCSGVIVRGTRQNLPDGQYAWEPYPRGRTLDTSFSFLRADIKMPRLAWSYSNGFIIAPPESLSVNCFFPADAESDRRTDNGCGPDKAYLYRYSPCNALLTQRLAPPRETEEYQWALQRLAALWLTWDERHAPDMKRRCSYDLRDAHATQRFEIALAVATKVSRLTDKPNDLKIQTWNPGHDPRLPIRAFFYVNEQGRPFAERDREQFERMTTIRLPVLKVTFPGEREGSIVFEVADQ